MDLIRCHRLPLRVAKSITVITVMGVVAAAAAAPPVKRARPPKFAKSIEDAFFPDALEKLTGPRPSRKATPLPSTADVPKPLASDQPARFMWSKLISAEVIEDEIKSQQRQLTATVNSATAFKGGAFRDARASLALLAALFAMDAQFDGSIRWQRDAAAISQVSARAALNCKVGTDATYREARKVADDMETLVRGGSLAGSSESGELSWSKIAERSQLMKRLEQSQQQALAPWTATPAEFTRHPDKLSHEAQLVAVLAEVIADPSYDLADDDTYREYAQAMQTQAIAVREAVSQNRADTARQAVGELTKACAACHEGYRN